MCEDEALGMDALPSGGGQRILATKSGVCRRVSGGAAAPQGLSGWFRQMGEKDGGKEAEPGHAQSADRLADGAV